MYDFDSGVAKDCSFDERSALSQKCEGSMRFRHWHFLNNDVSSTPFSSAFSLDHGKGSSRVLEFFA